MATEQPAALRSRRWPGALFLMATWWGVTYGVGALRAPWLQPAWFPVLGVVVTNGLGLVAVVVAARVLRRAGWLGTRSSDLGRVSGWRMPARRLLLVTPLNVLILGYAFIGRDGVPAVAGGLPLLIGSGAAMLAVGLSEEVASRGLPLGIMMTSGRLWSAAALTSVTFGLWHLGNWLLFEQGLGDTLWQVAATTAFGFCLAGVRLAGAALWPPVVLHAANDWFQLNTPSAAPFWYQVLVLVVHLGWGAALVRLAVSSGTRRPG